MFDSKRFVAVLCFTLMLGTALAGCMGGGPGDGGGDGTSLTTEEARTEIQDSLTGVKTGSLTGADKVSVNMTITNNTGDEPKKGYLTMYLDAELDELVFEMSGEAFTSGGGATGQLSSLVIAQMGKTSLFGGNGTLVSYYNQSATGVDSFEKAGNITPETGSGDTGSPAAFFDVVADNVTTEVDSFTTKEITFQGKDALEITSEAGPEDEGTWLRAVIWLDPKRPALLEGRIASEDASDGSPVAQGGEFKMTFQYGDDASHPLRDALVRGETITFREKPTNPFGGGDEGTGNWVNRTVQPSRDLSEGEVSTDQITALVKKQTGFNAEETVIEMGLEEGTATAEGNATLTFEDADGNGLVNEGDELRLEKHDHNATFTMALEDEKTGLRYTPSAGLALVLAALGAAAALVGNRHWD